MKNIAHCNLATGEYGVTVLDADLNEIEVRIILPDEVVELSLTEPVNLYRIDQSGVASTVASFSSIEINEISASFADDTSDYEAGEVQYYIGTTDYTSDVIKFNIAETLYADSDDIYIDYVNGIFKIKKVESTGWQKATLSSSFKIYDDVEGNAPEYRKDGRMVEIRGQVSPTSNLAAESSATIFTLPVGYRPTKTVHHLCQGSTKKIWLLSITSKGSVSFNRYGAGTFEEATTAAWLPFYCIFSVD